MPELFNPSQGPLSRGGLFLTALLLVLTQGGVLTSCSSSMDPEPNNLLLVTIDTLRADRLGCTGYAPARTPVLDGLAAKGVLHSCCIVSTPITLPSHASLLTGLLPHELAVRDNSSFCLSQDASTLAEKLKKEGYRTLAVVSGEPLAPGCGLEQGFDSYLFRPLPQSSKALLGETTAQHTTTLALETMEASLGEAPFFLWVHYFDPHHPYEPPAAFDSLAHPYDGEVAFVDREIGRLLNGLKRQDILTRTIVAITSDHGEGLGDHDEETHAFFLYDSTLRVPLILEGPGIAGGRQCSTQICTVNLMDTLLGLLNSPGIRSPGSTQWLAYLKGERQSFDPIPAFSESLYCYRSFQWAQMCSIRTQERKLIRGARDACYDLANDPTEKDPVKQGQADRLTKEMDRIKENARSVVAPGSSIAQDLPGYFSGTLGSEAAFLAEAKNRTLPHPPDRPQLINDLLAAVAQTSAGQVNQARILLEKLSIEDPENPAVLFWLARVVRDQGEREKSVALIKQAQALFSRVCLIDRENRNAFHMSAWCLLQVGEFAETQVALDNWAATGKADSKTWELYGFLYATRVSGGKTNPLFAAAKAFQFFDRSLASNPNNGRLLERLVVLAGTLQEKERKKIYSTALYLLKKEGWK